MNKLLTSGDTLQQVNASTAPGCITTSHWNTSLSPSTVSCSTVPMLASHVFAFFSRTSFHTPYAALADVRDAAVLEAASLGARVALLLALSRSAAPDSDKAGDSATAAAFAPLGLAAGGGGVGAGFSGAACLTGGDCVALGLLGSRDPAGSALVAVFAAAPVPGAVPPAAEVGMRVLPAASPGFASADTLATGGAAATARPGAAVPFEVRAATGPAAAPDGSLRAGPAATSSPSPPCPPPDFAPDAAVACR